MEVIAYKKHGNYVSCMTEEKVEYNNGLCPGGCPQSMTRRQIIGKQVIEGVRQIKLSKSPTGRSSISPQSR